MQVRLVRGEWKQDEHGFYEHVSSTEGYCMAVQLSEHDGFAKVVGIVKTKLGLQARDDIELSYQWPAWKMGPDWKRVNPIHILDDKDMALFLAIRTDLEEVYLQVKLSNKDNGEQNVYSASCKPSLGPLTIGTVGDTYWGSGLSQLLTMECRGKAGGVRIRAGGLDNTTRAISSENANNNVSVGKGNTSFNDSNIVVNDTSILLSRAIASEKGKQHLVPQPVPRIANPGEWDNVGNVENGGFSEGSIGVIQAVARDKGKQPLVPPHIQASDNPGNWDDFELWQKESH